MNDPIIAQISDSVNDLRPDWQAYRDAGGTLTFARWRSGFRQYCEALADAVQWAWENGADAQDAPAHQTVLRLGEALKLRRAHG